MAAAAKNGPRTFSRRWNGCAGVCLPRNNAVVVDSAWSNESWLRPLLAETLGQEPVASLAADGRPLWEAVVAAGLLSDEQLLTLAAERFRLPIADVVGRTADARATLPERWARRYRVLPLRAADGALEIATADPLNMDCERAIAFAVGRPVKLTLASPLSLSRELDVAYRDEPPPQRMDVQPIDEE